MTKYLVMKPHFSDDVCVDTPSAFVVQISAEFLDFLRILGETVAPFVERLKDFGFTKGEVNARFGDWMGLQDDRVEEEETVERRLTVRGKPESVRIQERLVRSVKEKIIRHFVQGCGRG